MSTLLNDIQALGIQFTNTHFAVTLTDGRLLSIPIHWYPRLAYGTSTERTNYEFLDGAIHWPELDEDIEIGALLNGLRSGESEKSLNKFYRWIQARRAGETDAPFVIAIDHPEAIQS